MGGDLGEPSGENGQPVPPPSPSLPAPPPPAPEADANAVPQFGILDSLIKLGVQAHPAVRYSVAVLGVIAAAVVAMRIVAPVSGDVGPFRMIAGLFILMLVMMVLFVLFAQFADPNNKFMQWAGRILSLVAIVALLGGVGFCAWAVATDSKPNCRLVVLLIGEKAAHCDDVAPPPLPLPIIAGRVFNAKDDQMGMPATVKIYTDQTRQVTANENGDFTFTLGVGDIGRTAKLWTTAVGFKHLPTLTFTVKAGQDVARELALDPEDASPAAAASFRTLEIPKPIINSIQANNATKIQVQGASFGGPKAGNYAAEWFDGTGWRFALFYCQTGDAGRSKILAEQVKQILQSQRGVTGQINVTLWPTVPGYVVPTSAITINSRAERSVMIDPLRRLLTPYIAANESVAVHPVGTSFGQYVSIVACRG